MIELWDIRDEQGERTGETVRRGDPMLPGQYHLVVEVWIRNLNGKYLISKRAPNKPAPNMWEATCGSALAGEDSLTAALREVKEEVGMTLSPGKGRIIHRGIRPGAVGSGIWETWLFEEAVPDLEPVCQPDEVSEAKWATKAEIQALIDRGVFVSHSGERLAQLD